jgi:hypothetical protein
MNLAELQRKTAKTWGVRPRAGDPLSINQLYLALSLSDTAGRIALYSRKRIREGQTFESYDESVARSIGDCIWFLSELATAHGKRLDHIVSSMLRRTELRWPSGRTTVARLIRTTIRGFEKGAPKKERLPDRLRVEFIKSTTRRAGYRSVSLTTGDSQIGDTINDNAILEDHYRFHDAVHLAFMVYLGWSPVMRALLKRKRKFNRQIDRTQDGARAADTEEVVVRRTFIEAQRNRFYVDSGHVDTTLLEEIQLMVKGLEVEGLPAVAWQEAILKGYKIHRKLVENDGGVVIADRATRKLIYRKLRAAREKELRRMVQSAQRKQKSAQS